MSSNPSDTTHTNAPIYHWDDPDGSGWALGWEPSRASFHATKLTHDDTGAEVIVDEVGLHGSRISSVDKLAAAMHRTLPDNLTRDLESDALGQVALPSDDEIPTPGSAQAPRDAPGQRRLGAHYRIDPDDASWWELGWDRPLGTFYAQRFSVDAAGDEQVLSDIGNDLSEIPTIGQLGEHMGRPVPAGIAHDLAADAAAFPFERAPHTMAGAEMLVLTPEPGAGTVPAGQLAQWEASLRRWEDRLSGWAQSLYAQEGVEPRWSLPAAPVTDALRNLPATGVDNDPAMFATGIGLDTAFVENLLAGNITELDIGQIAQVCDGLHCSPYDLWGTDQARGILHAYGPEHWPRHIEPLDEGRPPAGDEFIRRRVESEVAHQLRLTNEPPTRDPQPADATEPPMSVTCYRRDALLAREPNDVTRIVADPSEASPHAEYHFAFRQVTEPRALTLPDPNTARTYQPSPMGWDVNPALATVADRFRAQPWLPSVDLVRFVDPAGHETWLGWDPTSQAWEEWDDPRRHYPGPATDVLDPGQFTDPDPAPQLRVVEEIPGADTSEAVEMDERPDPTDAYDLTSAERAVEEDPIRVYESSPDLDF
jgi:hypothetical protein